MERTKKQILVLGLVLGLALSSSATVKAQEILKIGVIATFSGPGAPWGVVWKKTALFEQEKHNAAGGLPVGDKRYKLEFIFEDDKFTGATSRMAAEKLIFKDKVKFILGPISSGSRQAWQEITKEHNLVV